MLRKDVSVVVVGAGMAGLSTAHHLLQAGFSQVTILEGSDRYGGRIKTVRPEENERVVELGATCIHGASLDNPIYKMAADWGMVDSLVPLDRISGQFYQENGEIIDKELIRQVWELYMNMENSLSEIYIKRNKMDPFQNSTSFAQYVQLAKPEILQQFPAGENREAAEKAFNCMLNFCQFINGDELGRLSADLCGKYQWIPGPEMIFTGNGFSGLIEHLMKEIPQENVHYNSEVTQVFWSQGQAKVICKNGENYIADHVVVTCPLGHLKANHTKLFVPQLPEAKICAIERIGFGRVTKLLLYYDQPFWSEGIRFAWSAHETAETPADWVKDLVGFVEQPSNRKVIGGPFAGRGAEIIETLSDEEVSATCLDLLRKFLKDPSIPKPTKVLRSSWNSDPLYKGAYSYLSTKSQENDNEILAEPLPDGIRPTLLFAGEATHTNYYSTVHGAYLSGVRESNRLKELYKI